MSTQTDPVSGSVISTFATVRCMCRSSDYLGRACQVCSFDGVCLELRRKLSASGWCLFGRLCQRGGGTSSSPGKLSKARPCTSRQHFIQLSTTKTPFWIVKETTWPSTQAGEPEGDYETTFTYVDRHQRVRVTCWRLSTFRGDSEVTTASTSYIYLSRHDMPRACFQRLCQK